MCFEQIIWMDGLAATNFHVQAKSTQPPITSRRCRMASELRSQARRRRRVESRGILASPHWRGSDPPESSVSNSSDVFTPMVLGHQQCIFDHVYLQSFPLLLTHRTG